MLCLLSEKRRGMLTRGSLRQLGIENLLPYIHKSLAFLTCFKAQVLLEQNQHQHFPQRPLPEDDKLTCTMGMTKDRVFPLPVGAETQMSLGRYPPRPSRYPLEALWRMAGITSACTEQNHKQTQTVCFRSSPTTENVIEKRF